MFFCFDSCSRWPSHLLEQAFLGQRLLHRRARRHAALIGGQSGPARKIQADMWRPRTHCEQVGVRHTEALAHEIGLRLEYHHDMGETLSQTHKKQGLTVRRDTWIE